jgi:hypothetical protein
LILGFMSSSVFLQRALRPSPTKWRAEGAPS